VLFLCLSDAAAKLLTDRYSPPQILFLRALIALPAVMALALALGGRRALRTRHPGLHLARGALNVVSAWFFYLGLRAMPLAETTAISYAAPMFVTALSVVLLKERVDGPRWLALAAGFTGVLIIVQPGSASFQPAALLPLSTALLYAIMMITARAIGQGESMLTTMFYIVAAQAAASAVLAPWFWLPVQSADLPAFAGVAVFSTLGLTLITQGFRIGPASVVAPYDYTGLLWATLLGWLVWGDTPGLAVCVGALFIAASGVYIAWRAARPRRPGDRASRA